MRILPILVAAALSTPAYATTWYYGGQSCQSGFGEVQNWSTGAVSPALGYSAYGAKNYSSGLVWASCPAFGFNYQNVILSGAMVMVDDTSGTDAVACSVIAQNWDGGIYTSQTRYACSTYGGCSSNSQPSFQGFSTLVFSSTDLYGGQLYPMSLEVSCYLPSNGSQIRHYRITTN